MRSGTSISSGSIASSSGRGDARRRRRPRRRAIRRRARRLGSSRTRRIDAELPGDPASSSAPPPATASDARRPTCSPSQPPSSAPGPAGIRISQRIVLVIRPSSGAGVTAWRKARKLMKMKHRAGREQHQHAARTPRRPRRWPARRRAAASRRRTRRSRACRHGPGADAAADAVAEHAREHGADAHAGEAEADRLLGEAERARREQDLDDDRRLVAGLPAADRERQRDQQPVARRRSARRLAGRARTGARVAPSAPLARGSCTRTPRRISAETVTITASTSNASGAPTSLISAPARPGPATSAPDDGERVLGVRLDQPVARDDLREHDLRRAAGDGVDRADHEAARRTATGIESQPSPPGERHAGDRPAPSVSSPAT